MIYANLFEQAGPKTVRAGLIGTGTYGISLLAQVRHINGLEISFVCDRDLSAARTACRAADIPEERIAVCDSRAAIHKALARDMHIITADADLLFDAPLDVIVECTGHPESGARHAESALRNGKHVAMVNKETDSVVGPRLHQLADRQGVVYTPVDGDQHGLLIGLVGWARQIGLEVVCGGKARADDYVFDQNRRIIRYASQSITLSADQCTALKKHRLNDTTPAMANRKALLADLPGAGAADLCESVIAANATGLVPDIPTLHAPIARITEIAEVLCGQDHGGLLRGSGKIDVIGCLRRPDEAGMNGGVFVVVSGKNAAAWKLLTEKGLTSNHRGTCGLVYRPYHLLGVETPISILCAGLLKKTTGSTSFRLAHDLVARTTRNIKKGTVIRSIHAKADPMLEPLIIPSATATSGNPIPFYMAVNNRLNTEVPAGTMLTANMIEPPAASRLWVLRREMEKNFRL